MSETKNVYLDLESSTGKFFEYSKVEKDGFVKHVGENPTTKVSVISYRKYYVNGVFGNLIGFSHREIKISERATTILSVVLSNPIEDKMYFLKIPLFTSKNRISDYAMSIIRYLPFLEKGTPYRVFPYSFETKNTQVVRKVYGFKIDIARLSDSAHDDLNKIPQLTFEVKKLDAKGNEVVTKGDIPSIEWEEHLGKKSPNTKKRDSYLWGLLQEKGITYESAGYSKNTFNSKEEGVEIVTNDISESKNNSISPNNNFDNTVLKEPISVDSEEEDDLPF